MRCDEMICTVGTLYDFQLENRVRVSKGQKNVSRWTQNAKILHRFLFQSNYKRMLQNIALYVVDSLIQFALK